MNVQGKFLKIILSTDTISMKNWLKKIVLYLNYAIKNIFYKKEDNILVINANKTESVMEGTPLSTQLKM